MSDLFEIEKKSITDQTSMKNVQRWDSLKHLAFIAALEENFGLPMFDMDEIVEMTSFKAVRTILGAKLESN